jgi:hypothetical protein
MGFHKPGTDMEGAPPPPPPPPPAVGGGGGSIEEKDLAIKTEVLAHPFAGGSWAHDKQMGFWATIQTFAGRFGVEQRGIERVLPDERTDTSVSKLGTLVRTSRMNMEAPRPARHSGSEADETCALLARQTTPVLT